jgi:hypothetical protein
MSAANASSSLSASQKQHTRAPIDEARDLPPDSPGGITQARRQRCRLPKLHPSESPPRRLWTWVIVFEQLYEPLGAPASPTAPTASLPRSEHPHHLFATNAAQRVRTWARPAIRLREGRLPLRDRSFSPGTLRVVPRRRRPYAIARSERQSAPASRGPPAASA